MASYGEREAAFEAWGERWSAFRMRPFPTDWAKVVAGVGLASFSMRVEKSFWKMSTMGVWKPWYVHRMGWAVPAVEDLRDILRQFDMFLPALPPEPRRYFEEFRSLAADALALTERWWAAADDRPAPS
jgi:hypothetical protein